MIINILEYLEKTVKDMPLKTAIIEGERSISFKDLDLTARSLANELCNLSCSNKPVAVFLPKSIECIISDIAITYSGNAYMNLDIKSPEVRLANVIRSIQPAAIITNEKLFDIISSNFPEIQIIKYENLNLVSDESTQRLDKIKRNAIDTDPLCIINTSGSTGTPKGAVLNHRSYIDYTEWAINTFNFNEKEILGVLSPVVFDHYNYEICLMMATGCTLVLLDNQFAAFPMVLLETLKKNNVSYIFWVPTIMVNIANMDLLSRIELPSVKMVWFAGEVFPTKQFNYWRKFLPSATFVNLYGPVETSVDCTFYIIERDLQDDEPIPIGFPCRNTDIFILNNENQPANANEEGELCVRGTSLAMGYYNNPEKTSGVFVQNPLNKSYPEIIYRTGDVVLRNDYGEMIFKGRKDTLIKHLGYRIELGEIEHVLINNLKIIDNGCVVYDQKKKEIILFYESKIDITGEQIRKSLVNVLPKYMIPTQYFKKDELPRNANGKIDRLYLKAHLNG